jgi:hypothetical protein
MLTAVTRDEDRKLRCVRCECGEQAEQRFREAEASPMWSRRLANTGDAARITPIETTKTGMAAAGVIGWRRPAAPAHRGER